VARQHEPARVAPAGAPEPDHVVLEPRDVRFEWHDMPLHWVPGEPFVSHVINVMHLLLPEGERWFVRVFTQALPLIREEKLREDVLGFIGQEAVHAEAHQGVADHLAAQGLDPDPAVRQVEHLFRSILYFRPGYHPSLEGSTSQAVAYLAASPAAQAAAR
jgi:Predicted metal-dependent hydrolase